MIQLTREQHEENNIWQTYWESCNRFFKVEAQQHYLAENQSDSLKAWLAGEKSKSLALLTLDAKAKKENLTGPKDKTRIHIVENPYHPYLEWEIEHYKHINIPLSQEDVFLVEKDVVTSNKLSRSDFMMFDDNKVAQSHYNSKGYLISWTFYNELDDITEFLKFRETLIQYAQSLKL